MNNRKIQNETSSVDHVYYNAIITNNSTVEAMPAVFNLNSQSAILDNPSEYYLSIIRFNAPLQGVPIFIFADGLYSVTINAGGVDYQTTLLYVADYSGFLPSNDPSARYIYQYQQFVDSINNAIATSNTASGTGLIAPYMTYDSTTLLFTMNFPTGFYNPAFSYLLQPITLSFNTNLWVFFNNFSKIFNGFVPNLLNANGKNYTLIVKPNGNNDIMIPVSKGGGPTAGYSLVQEFNSISDWNAIRKISFETGSIPIRPESQPTNVNPNPPSGGVPIVLINNTSIGSASQPILTDFLVSDVTALRNDVIYNPQSEYRLVDLTGTTPLRNIDLKVYWIDKNLRKFPIYIQPLNSLSVKFLFRKKSLKGSISYYN